MIVWTAGRSRGQWPRAFGGMDVNRVPQVSGDDFILDEDEANEEWNSVLKPGDIPSGNGLCHM